MGDHIRDEELEATKTPGFKVGEQKTLDEYTQLDANDESLNKWKASLGITGDSKAVSGPKLTIHTLAFESASAPGGSVQIRLDGSDAELEALKKNPLTIKEGVEYNIAITFSVGAMVLSGLKYLHVVKRAGMTVDKLEEMIGSYGPRAEPYTKRFITEEAPSGMLARSGANIVRSRIIDDDGNVYTDFTWAFKIGKDWK